MDDSLTICVGLIAFLAFVGNVLITLVGLKLPAHPKNLTQVFLISLSAADIVLSLQVPFYILGLKNDSHDGSPPKYFIPTPHLDWTYSASSQTLGVLCSISSFLLWTTIKANIFMVMVMGLDRMAATCYAAAYLKKVKRQYAVVAVTIVWVLSILLSALPGLLVLITGDSNPYSYDNRFHTCTPLPDFCRSKTTTSHYLVYFLIELVVTFVVPLICITICYILICSKIFSLKKIRTIRRHFSKKQLFKSSKSNCKHESKASTPEGPSELRLCEKDASVSMINTEVNVDGEKRNSLLALGSKSGGWESSTSGYKPEFNFRVNANPTAEPRAASWAKTSTLENETTPCFRLKTGETDNPRLRIQTEHQITESVSNFQVRTEPPITESVSSFTSKTDPAPPKFGLYPSTARVGADSEPVCSPLYEEETTPQPIQYSIDPTMQRRRFNFFTGDDQEFAECPEPGSKTGGILASSLNVIEKHYSAIEQAQKELAKKMRVYKYQIRVARTAVVVCTFFFVCYLVYEVGTLYVIWGIGCEEEYGEPHSNRIKNFIKMCHLFLFLNSALNVLVYGLMHRSVRATMSKICSACTRKSHSSSA